MKDPMLGRRPYNALIVRMSDLTDILHGLPAYRALAKRYPRTRFYWLVDTPYTELLRGLPGLVEPIRFERPELTRELKTLERFWEAWIRLWAFIRFLRAYCLVLAVVLQPRLRASFFAWASGARVITGFRRLAQGGFLLLTHRQKVSKKQHAIVQNVRALESFEVERAPERQPIVLSEDEHEQARAFLVEHGLKPGAFVAIHPGSSHACKRWSIEGYAALADRLNEAGETPAVLSFCEGEEELARQVAAQMRSRVVLFNGGDLRKLAALFTQAALVVAPDTGPLHLACAQGAPVVGLYGPTDESLRGPFWEPYRVVRTRPHCGAFCRWRHRHDSEPCPCMRQLPLEPVAAACRELLTTRRPLT